MPKGRFIIFVHDWTGWLSGIPAKSAIVDQPDIGSTAADSHNEA